MTATLMIGEGQLLWSWRTASYQVRLYWVEFVADGGLAEPKALNRGKFRFGRPLVAVSGYFSNTAFRRRHILPAEGASVAWPVSAL